MQDLYETLASLFPADVALDLASFVPMHNCGKCKIVGCEVVVLPLVLPMNIRSQKDLPFKHTNMHSHCKCCVSQCLCIGSAKPDFHLSAPYVRCTLCSFGCAMDTCENITCFSCTEACAFCNKERVCSEHQLLDVRCHFCSTTYTLCDNCYQKCSHCGVLQCNHCVGLQTCGNCLEMVCMEHLKTTTSSCHTQCCPRCQVTCANHAECAESDLCIDCATVCNGCGAQFCTKCCPGEYCDVWCSQVKAKRHSFSTASSLVKKRKANEQP